MKKNTQGDGRLLPSLPKSKPVTRGTRENRTRWLRRNVSGHNPGPASQPNQSVQSAGRPPLDGWWANQARRFDRCWRRSHPGLFLFGTGLEGGGQTPNYATGLAYLQAPFFVDQSLSRMGLLWGFLGSAGGSVPLLASNPCLPSDTHMYLVPLSLFARQRDIILQQHDTIVWSSMPNRAAAVAAAEAAARNTRSRRLAGGRRRRRGGTWELAHARTHQSGQDKNHDAVAANDAPFAAWRIPSLAYHSHTIRMPFRGSGTARTHTHAHKICNRTVSRLVSSP